MKVPNQIFRKKVRDPLFVGKRRFKNFPHFYPKKSGIWVGEGKFFRLEGICCENEYLKQVFL
jgi:hypothetical protein